MSAPMPKVGPVKYDSPEEGEWYRPRQKGWKMRCCDCDLVHIFEFSRPVRVRVWRDERSTAASRRRRPRKR